MKISDENIKSFLEFIKAKELTFNTTSKYVRDVNKLADFLNGEDVSREKIIEFKSSLAETYKPVSVNSVLVAVNLFLKFVGLNNFCVTQLKIQRQMFRRSSLVLSEKEYRALIDSAVKRGDRQIAVIIQTIAATGVRVSELKYFTLEGVYAGIIEVRNKGKSREIILKKGIQNLLLKYCKNNFILSGEIFLSAKNKKPLDRSVIWKRMKALCSMAGVASEKVFPHNLRHYFAIAYYKVAKDLIGLSSLLGHKSIETTRRYLMPSIQSCRKILDAMFIPIKKIT